MSNFRPFAGSAKKIVASSLLLIVAVLFAAFGVCAQEIETTFTVEAVEPGRIRVEGKFINPAAATKNWSFLRSYADVSGLEKRIENLRLLDSRGKSVEIKKLADGEFLTTENAISWRYDVKTGLSQPAAAAHVSLLNENGGLLMPNDLLPQFAGGATTARFKFELPAGWRISSGENQVGTGEFISKDAEKAVFLVGVNWREKTASIGGATVVFTTAGEWAFSDAESSLMANEILSEQIKIFGNVPAKRVRVFLLPFQQNSSPDDWRAETRGANLVLISGAVPFKSVALQRLHEQLRHELFHLWLPNAVNLRGNYDWFYEGFTVYQSLKTGVMLNQIRFQDFLDTLGSAFDLAKAGNRNVSLIDASNERWRGAGNLIYAKGMLTAFLCDTTLLRESGGKRSLTDIFQVVYTRHKFPKEPEDANAALLRILNERRELRPIAEKYISGKDEIDWAADLAALGVEIKTAGGRTRLEIGGEPKGRQKDLLDELGYNQWRKLIPKRK